jgi:PP-loop superfamily ATP-utilizing enzyme
MEIQKKLDGLKSFFHDKKVIVAFSGVQTAHYWH